MLLPQQNNNGNNNVGTFKKNDIVLNIKYGWNEARIEFLTQFGYPYDKLEEMGIISPVIGIECDYKTSTTFSDEVEIEVKIKEFKGVRLVIEYTMTNLKTEELVANDITKHCFVNTEGKPVILKKSFPEFDQKLKELI